jgi:hypothetical protein
MGQEQNAERHAEHGGGIGSGAAVDHGRSPGGRIPLICLLPLELIIRSA